MSVTLTITDAGRQAIVNAESNGTAPLTISQIGVGTGAYTPTSSQTALQSETKRLSTISGQIVAADTMHVTVEDSTSDAYDVSEFGLYFSDGTLFAVYAVASGTIMSKTAATSLLLSADVVFADINATSLTFGDTTFSNPPASETVKGVIQLVDKPTVLAGADATKAVTALRLNDFVMRYALGVLAPGQQMAAIADLNAAALGWGIINSSTANSPRSGSYAICFTFSSDGKATPSSSNYIFQLIFWTDGVKQERYNISDAGWVIETQWTDKNFTPSNYLPLHGTADNASKLGNQSPSYYAAASALSGYLPLHGKADTAGTADNAGALSGLAYTAFWRKSDFAISNYAELAQFYITGSGANIPNVQFRVGSASVGAQTGTVTFSPAFSNACLGAVACIGASLDKYDTGVTGWSRTGFNYHMGANFQSTSLRYIAVGY